MFGNSQLTKIKDNNICECEEMAGLYTEAFKRTNKTGLYQKR